jgi:16S rRNA processing protein RimM
VARALGPKGLKGGIRVELLTDWPERLVPGLELWPEGEPDALRIAAVETGGRAPVLHFAGIATRDAAAALSGRYLEGAPSLLEPGTYYWDDLLGLRVTSAAGDPIGEVVEVFRAGGNEVYRVVGPAGERLVPALRSAVLAIDIEARTMVVADDDAEEVR